MINRTPNTILVATQNKDKFCIVVDILERIGSQKYNYVSLVNFNITEDVKESGTTEERAKQKVLFYKNICEKKNLLGNVIAIVGVDDGIFIKKEGFSTAESKEITDQILSGTRINIGDEIDIRRSYFLTNIKTKEELSCTTNIPFQFLGNPNGITRQSGKYPLSYVIGHLNSDVKVADNSNNSNIDYNVIHSQELLPILKIING